MFDNLFDWEQPNDKSLNHIKEYGKKELAKAKSSIFLKFYIMLVTLEFYPIFITAGILVNYYINETATKKHVFMGISSIFVILIFVISYYIFTVRKKKKVLIDINNNKIKTFSAVVQEKNKKRTILVQLPGEDDKSYAIPKNLYNEIESGSPLIAIKYDNKNGFNDKYDFIKDPNIIAQDEE